MSESQNMGRGRARRAAQQNGVKSARRARPRIRWSGCVLAEMVKATSLRSTWWMLAIDVVLAVGGAALAAWGYILVAQMEVAAHRPGGSSALGSAATSTTDLPQGPMTISGVAQWLSVTGFLSTAVFAVAVFSIMFIGSEYAQGVIRVGLMVNPRRGRYVMAKAVVVAILTLVTSLVAVLLSYAAVLMVLRDQHVQPLPSDQWGLPWIAVLGAPMMCACVALVAFGLGAVCRSTPGGVFAFIGLYMIAPAIMGLLTLNEDWAWIRGITNCLPSQAVSNFLTGSANTGVSVGSVTLRDGSYFDPTWWQSGLIVLVWAAVSLFAGVVVTKRSDVH